MEERKIQKELKAARKSEQCLFKKKKLKPCQVSVTLPNAFLSDIFCWCHTLSNAAKSCRRRHAHHFGLEKQLLIPRLLTRERENH